MFVLTLTCALACQEPVPPAPAPAPNPAPATPAEAPPAPITVKTWDDATAKAELAGFAKVMKGTPSLLEKTRALDALAAGSHVMLLKPLGEVVEKDKAVVVRKRAAELLANQPAKEANAAIRALLKNTKVLSSPPVSAQLVRALANCGYDGKQWKEIAGLFEREYTAEAVPLQEALLDLIVKHGEKQAIDLLVRNIDEPAPVDVHAADNPPAEYWEARWKAWSAWKAKVKDALFALTGQRFSTAAEAQAWLKKNR